MTKRFRWTRAKYKRAHHLNRLLEHVPGPWNPPPLVERFLKLWEQHPQMYDPLTLPLEFRYDRSDVPF